jgi:hypothetical protein
MARKAFYIYTCPLTGEETYCFFEAKDEGEVLHTEKGARLISQKWKQPHIERFEMVKASSAETDVLTDALEGALDEAAEKKGMSAVTLALRHIRGARGLSHLEKSAPEDTPAPEDTSTTEVDPGPYAGLATTISQNVQSASL